MNAAVLHSRRTAPPTATPWGTADTLRSRMLRPGPGNSPDAVARNQRERLFGATVAVVAEHGYVSTRVADILHVAGVSRSAFYRHFDNKQECFLATLDALTVTSAEMLSDAYDGDAPWDERLHGVLEALVEMIVAQPAAAQLWFIEVYAAGAAAVERMERLSDEIERLSIDAIGETPERSAMPPQGVRAVLGGLRQIIQTRLRTRRELELVELVPDLLEWALSYRTPPERLRRPRKPPPLSAPARRSDDSRHRILAAVTETVAGKGYQAMTVTEIAQRAAVSLNTFYAHFDGKDAAFLAALDDGEQQLVDVALPAFQHAHDWPTAVRDCVYAFFAFNAHNPAMATIGGLSVFAVGPAGFDRHERATTRIQAMLHEGFVEHPSTPAIVGEAIGGSIAALLYQQIRRNGAERLYEVASVGTFIALAPFVGASQACELANAGWHPTSSARRRPATKPGGDARR